MNYKKIYDDLIESAKNEPKKDSYKELHHIIPLCMGGSDDKSNKIYLTARQHYLAHWLLYKMYKTSALVHAWHSMSRIGKGQEDRSINSHLFEYCKRERSKLLSIQYSGEGNNFYNKKHSQKSLQLMSEKLTGKKASKETKELMSKLRKGVKKSDEHKKKIGRKGLISLKNVDTGDCIRIPKEELDSYDQTVWINPYTYKCLTNTKEIKCDVCGKIGKDNSTFKRWHFNNCRGIK